MNIELYKKQLEAAKIFWLIFTIILAFLAYCHFLNQNLYSYIGGISCGMIWFWLVLRILFMRKVVSDVTKWTESGLLNQLEDHGKSLQ